MALKLHGVPFSSCTARVLTCLHEKGLEFELVPVDLFTAQNKHPDFLSKNPFGLVPVLEDGDFTIFESRAITEYLAKKFKETGIDVIRLNSLADSTTVRVWVEVESHQFQPAMSPIVYQFFVAPLGGQTPNQAIIDENLEKLGKILDIYESQLSKTKYLAGDFYSLADLHHLPYLFYFMKTPWAGLVNDRPHVRAWWEDISSRPAFKKVSEGMTFGDDKK